MDGPTYRHDAELPEIPHVDLTDGGVVALADAVPDRFQAIIYAGRNHYGTMAMAIGNELSRRWLKRNANRYLAEIDDTATRAGMLGAHLLNMSYEWSCTSSVAPNPRGDGLQLLRTLDWPLDGLGRNVVAARMAGAAGDYENVTWPGFSGICTAMAPGRFAAAINQPPIHKWTRLSWFDWMINRGRVWRSRELPPMHLLRQVFDCCNTYAEAKDELTNTTLAMPAFFTLVGIKVGEGCVIERTENEAYVRESPASVTNHWVGCRQPGRYRGFDSEGRYAQMEAIRNTAAATSPFDWVTLPILNPTTRLAVVANPKNGRLAVQGWESDGPATAVFELSA